MKLSDYVVDRLVQSGSRHVFGISGGAAVHLFDSSVKHPGMEVTFVAHEQTAAIAADGYSRLAGNLGACVVTSGPGATNLLTGVCCSYYDSVPTLMLTGQVATHRLRGERKVRQVGFQETDVLSIFSSVTKYGAQLLEPSRIGAMLDEAYFRANEGRPGPVLLDIPDDLQRAEVDPARLARFERPRTASPTLEAEAKKLLGLLAAAKRPAVVIGGGLSTPRCETALREFLRRVNVPVLQSWAGLDLIPHDWPLRVGPFGVYGPRLGNFVAQRADLLLCLGTRLSQNLTGGMLKTFAPGAAIAMVDADRGELDKFDGRGITISTRVQAGLGDFLDAALASMGDYRSADRRAWLSKIEGWRKEVPDDVPPPAADHAGHVDAIGFVRELSEHLAADEAIFVDTGGNLTWTCNHIALKKDQRLISAWNFTPMGYALPAAIGGCAAQPGRPITCITGDGGLVLCLGELATVVRYGLPIKIILFNNHGHGIQKQTLETWLEGRYAGVDEKSGLAFPDFRASAAAAGMPVVDIRRTSDVSAKLREVFSARGPVLCNVEINPDQKLYPVLKYGNPLENQMPFLDASRLSRLIGE